MKKILLLLVAGSLGLVACDHVDDPYPEAIPQGSYELYPLGDSAHYADNAWPSFSNNTNTVRNLLIEDFTGHQCTYCPPAADTAHSLHNDFGSRALIATIHAGPTGNGAFQSTNSSYPIDWTNTEGLAIGEYFGSLPGSGFIGNPRGSISRILTGGQHTLPMNDWRGVVNSALATSLKVNIQSAANYYPSTRGLFLHTEMEVLDGSLNLDDLYAVVYLMEDSLIAKQKMPDNTTNDTYIHRDIMRETIGSTWQGIQLSTADEQNGKYYLNYIYELPDGSPGGASTYDPEHMHLLIYVRDAVTDEIYHVIKQKLQ